MRTDQLQTADQGFADLLKFVGFAQLQLDFHKLSKNLTTRPFYRPINLLGGQSVRDEQIGHNSFGALIALAYRHVFNPTSREERAFIVKNAYVPSKQRDRYIDPIDRIIRASVPLSEQDAQPIEDTERPNIFVNVFRREQKTIEQQILLLIGGVGSGKSTFVDYLEEVALPEDIKKTTLWVRINMNNAPLDISQIYTWLANQITAEIQHIHRETDFDEFKNVEKIYAVELNSLKKSALSLFPKESMEYKTRLADAIIRLQNDSTATAKAYTRHLGTERGKLIVLILDNCDKRIRDEQLLMFQAAQWLQQQFRCLIILPLRDETYDNHRNEPPLDTALKDLAFRIAPPSFQSVLTKRLDLAITEMYGRERLTGSLEYTLPNGIRVSYPAAKQASYLRSISRSIFEYDRFVRRIIVGLAGRDIRKAMEIFLEFCRSGYIGEDEIFKITQAAGSYVLPYHVVTRVLLRLNRRFYNSDASYIKNLLACNPEDHHPNYFTRLAILRWLNVRFNEKGPTGLKGYHPVRELKADLFPIGLTNEMVQRELLYLLNANCVLSENLRKDNIYDDDLIKQSPAGAVHLDLITNPDYLAAISEDTWFDNKAIALEISGRIGGNTHYDIQSIVKNSETVVDYLQSKLQSTYPSPNSYLVGNSWQHLTDVSEAARRYVKYCVNSSRERQVVSECV